MSTNINVTKAKLDVTSIRQAAQDPGAGAVVVFEGCTRNTHNNRPVKILAYEAFVSMAELELEQIRQKAINLYKLDKCLIHHRLGEVPIMETALVVACSAAHRREALDATAWIIDHIKECVPIWKREKYIDGAEAWIEGNNRQD
jgi:molybdopterin synthase catalytic subunit